MCGRSLGVSHGKTSVVRALGVDDHFLFVIVWALMISYITKIGWLVLGVY